MPLAKRRLGPKSKSTIRLAKKLGVRLTLGKTTHKYKSIALLRKQVNRKCKLLKKRKHISTRTKRRCTRHRSVYRKRAGFGLNRDPLSLSNFKNGDLPLFTDGLTMTKLFSYNPPYGTALAGRGGFPPFYGDGVNPNYYPDMDPMY